MSYNQSMDLNKEIMLSALKALEKKLPKKLNLIVGGGGALLLTDIFPLTTTDIDAIPQGMSLEDVNVLVKEVALELSIPGDWLNPWFSSFTHVLPDDFRDRLVEVYKGTNLTVDALGANDLLIMKCYAHRQKDIPHARALIRKGANTDFAADRILYLKSKKIPQSDQALDFLDEVIELENGE